MRRTTKTPDRPRASAVARGSTSLAPSSAATAHALLPAGIPVSLNMLWALKGALSDRDWREVAKEDRLWLLVELERCGISP